MDELKPYAVFAETVAAGSMSAAARKLGITPSAVSQAIRALELQAGVTLLTRSTRKLSLTEAGERCYPHCRRLVEAAGAASAALDQARHAPSGELRVAAPVGFAAHIGEALAPLLEQWPQLRLRVLFDDAMIDLIDAQVDIAVRVGRMADTNWVGRKLGDLEVILCAAPAYLERHGTPAGPSDLAAHQWLAAVRDADGAHADGGPKSTHHPSMTLSLRDAKGASHEAQVGVRIASNNLLALRQMCEQGLGIARLGRVDVQDALTRGTLVRLLPQWRFATLPVTAVTARRAGASAKVRLALEALKHYFARLPAPGVLPRAGH